MNLVPSQMNEREVFKPPKVENCDCNSAPQSNNEEFRTLRCVLGGQLQTQLQEKTNIENELRLALQVSQAENELAKNRISELLIFVLEEKEKELEVSDEFNNKIMLQKTNPESESGSTARYDEDEMIDMSDKMSITSGKSEASHVSSLSDRSRVLSGSIKPQLNSRTTALSKENPYRSIASNIESISIYESYLQTERKSNVTQMDNQFDAPYCHISYENRDKMLISENTLQTQLSDAQKLNSVIMLEKNRLELEVESLTELVCQIVIETRMFMNGQGTNSRT